MENWLLTIKMEFDIMKEGEIMKRDFDKELTREQLDEIDDKEIKKIIDTNYKNCKIIQRNDGYDYSCRTTKGRVKC